MFLHVCGSSLGVWERFSHTLTQSSRTRPRGRGNDVGACVFHVVPVHRGPRTGNADYFRGRSSEERPAGGSACTKRSIRSVFAAMAMQHHGLMPAVGASVSCCLRSPEMGRSQRAFGSRRRAVSGATGVGDRT